MSLFKKLKGKKTYITAAITAAVAGAQALGVGIPVEVYGVLVALGLVSSRNATRDLKERVGL